MPTECERSVTSPSSSSSAVVAPSSSAAAAANVALELKDNLTDFYEDLQTNNMMEGDMSTSQTSTTSNGSSCNGGRKTSLTSADPTAYVAKARVTRPNPPPPPYNPMQFVQIKPCHLYQTAQEQLKKAEEVKKIKEIRKEEPEDWQNNLDNWKSSRRKRVEHIIDRVVEVKKLELEEHDRTRRKSKTFSEMIEERGDRPNARPLNKLVSLAVYAEDEANDLSDLGIGTSSASGKSSLSEDYDNNSVMSDNAAELDKAITNSKNSKTSNESTIREYISSPGYETSSSTAPASSPDPCEYTYEGAIQDYKQRVSRAASGLTSVALNSNSNNNKLTTQQQNSKESTPERAVKETAYPPRRGSKIEDRLMGFEVQSPSEECIEKNKVDVPKVDISKRKEIFESQQQQQQQQQSSNEPKSHVTTGGGNSTTVVPRVTLRDRFKMQDSAETISEQPKRDNKRLSGGDITSIKERLQNLEQQQNLVNGANGKTTANKLVDIPVPPLKERLSSLQNAATKEEVRKPPVVLVDARQLEIMKSEDQKVKQTMKDNAVVIEQQQQQKEKEEKEISITLTQPDDMKTEDNEIDRDDSGIHTADDIDIEERFQVDLDNKKEQELKLNAAIEALAMEEKQFSEAANAVNQIEAEFEELSLGSVAALPPLASSNSSATPITNDHMEYSVSSTNNSSSLTPHPSNSSESSLITNNPGVKGVDFKVTSNLRRKPTNEMVHAKNLLKIFKETFQNDIELDEDEISEEHETKNIKESCQAVQAKPVSLNIKTQIFQNSNTPSRLSNENSSKPNETSLISSPNTPPPIPPRSSTPQTPKSPILAYAQGSCLSETSLPSSSSPMSPSGIPRSMNPSGKPPMSPLTIRSTTKFVAVTPPASPSLGRKSDSQFSINGRVEIFNSKHMANPTNANSNLPKPTTPIMTTKKTQLPYINATTAAPAAAAVSATTPKSLQTNNIVLPQQQQEQQTKPVVTTKQHETAVIEPLSPTTVTTTAETVATIETDNQQTKSMPSQQMVNEPQMMLDAETNQITNDSLKQQQQQQPEVVICAPPITIVNPDELPKPNTVKNLSSCFQQQDATTPTYNSKMMGPKPLPRSRIPQATPPQSPVASRRHVCYSSSEQSSPLVLEDQNKKSSTNSQQSSSSPLEEQKNKLSMISSSSNSSTSTDSTVIEANKKLSIMSNVSSTSTEVPPTFGETNAQVHKEPENENISTESSNIISVDNPKPKAMDAKTLDKQATQALIDEMIRAENLSRNPPKSNMSPSSPKVGLKTNCLKFGEIKPYQSSSPKTSTPTSPVMSPKSELFKITKPLVVSTLYDKYLPEPLPPNNQRTPQISPKPKPTATTSPSISLPADLPPLIACPPNESSLYKLASSAPHSPTNPCSTPERNLIIDSALCNSLLTSLAATPDIAFQRQTTIEENLCQKVDKETLPFNIPITGFVDVSKQDIKRCDGLSPSSAQKLQGSTQRQHTVEEELCHKLDIQELPDGKQQPITGFKSISPTEIRKCDNFYGTYSAKPDSKPNSPIMEARAAHSKALIETCEKIIAEEKQASSQLKSSLPSSPRQTPIMPRKSKIPKPMSSCCTATESLNEADFRNTHQKEQPTTSPPQTPHEDKNAVIARMHVVETQIKVTTTTPPASPKTLNNKPQPSPKPAKKTKNIFDFLKKNFGVGGSAQTDEQQEPKEADSPKPEITSTSENKVLVLSAEDLRDLGEVKYDEIHKIENSKFYLPSGGEEEATPPPLPKTPAPVNIEIIRKITTDEIFEEGKTEMDLTKEIDDLLDDELSKLNHEVEKLDQLVKQ